MDGCLCSAKFFHLVFEDVPVCQSGTAQQQLLFQDTFIVFLLGRQNLNGSMHVPQRITQEKRQTCLEITRGQQLQQLPRDSQLDRQLVDFHRTPPGRAIAAVHHLRQRLQSAWEQ